MLDSKLTAAREEDDYDAADIDRELIASRLKQEVVSLPLSSRRSN